MYILGNVCAHVHMYKNTVCWAGRVHVYIYIPCTCMFLMSIDATVDCL